MATTESDDTNIRDIIQTHNQLALTYKQMMSVIQKQNFFFCFQREARPSEKAKKPKVIVSILRTVLILYECLLFYRVRAEKAYIIRPFVKYFLEDHVRRQYQTLHELYLSVFVIHRQPKEEADIRELRQIASDIENYSEALSRRRGIVKLVQALPIIATVFALFGLNIPLSMILSQATLVDTIVRWVVSVHVLIGITLCPLIAAFHLKRFMLENSVTESLQNLYITTGHESKLYPTSVYNLENRLFELLGGMEQKPKEVPVDILMRIGFGLFIVALSVSALMLVISGYTQPDPTDDNNNNLSTLTADEIIVGPILLAVSFYIVPSIIHYGYRRKRRLL
jgi:hypothetical protein